MELYRIKTVFVEIDVVGVMCREHSSQECFWASSLSLKSLSELCRLPFNVAAIENLYGCRLHPESLQ